MPAICLIPGLGFTSAVFQHLQLPKGEIYHLSWLVPRAKETLPEYATRMMDQATVPPGDVILLGHSFGGVMAQEIAKIRPTQKLVLISSVRSRAEVPFKYKVLAPTGLYRLFNRRMTLLTFPWWADLLGYQSKAEKALFVEMVGEQDDRYLQWALLQMARWSQETPLPIPTLQIHGTRDKTLPFRLIRQVDHTVDGGGHMMVFSQPEVVNPLIHAFIRF